MNDTDLIDNNKKEVEELSTGCIVSEMEIEVENMLGELEEDNISC